MKLAEALVRRADCQKKIAQLKQRLERNVKVQEGEQPSEDPVQLLAELEEAFAELTGWIQKINKTNGIVMFNDDLSIADALAERDILMQKRKIINELLEASTIKQDRYSRSEVKFVRTMDVPALQQQVDELSKNYRELDFKLQEKNWTIDLIDN